MKRAVAIVAVLLLGCHAVAPAPRPTRIAAEPVVSEAAHEAAQWWNDIAGCRLIVEGDGGWRVIVGGEMGHASTWPEARVITFNGIAEHNCRVAALIHEMGHVLGFSHADGGVMRERMACDIARWPPLPPPIGADRLRERCR